MRGATKVKTSEFASAIIEKHRGFRFQVSGVRQAPPR